MREGGTESLGLADAPIISRVDKQDPGVSLGVH